MRLQYAHSLWLKVGCDKRWQTCRSGLPRPRSFVMIAHPPSQTRPGNQSLRKGRASIPGQIYHVSARAQSSRSPFADPAVAFVVCKAFRYVMQVSDAKLLAWVLMPDHAHWLIELGERECLSVLVARLKSASAGACNDAAGNAVGTSLWQSGFYDRAIRRDEDVLAVARYIVANPLRARLVQRLGEYPWWNAVWV